MKHGMIRNYIIHNQLGDMPNGKSSYSISSQGREKR